MSYILVVTLAVSVVVALLLLRKKQSQLRRFEGISDVERYTKQRNEEAHKSVAECKAAQIEKDRTVEQIDSLKKQILQYQRVVHDFKSAAALRQYVQQLSAFAEGCKTVQDLRAKIDHHSALADQLKSDIEKLGYDLQMARSEGDLSSQIFVKKAELDSLRKDVLSVEEVRDLQEFAFYRRKYEFDSSQKYKQQLDSVRQEQEAMIKTKSAATCDTAWTVDGNVAKGRRMVSDKIKVLLRAFNGECDASIAKVTFSNATSMESRINRSFQQISKMGEINRVSISNRYLELKLQELYLTHEYQIQKEEEKEEQKRIKQIMKEEVRVEKEIQKAQEEAEREEMAKRRALELARAELHEQEGKHTTKLEMLVSKLELELQEAIDRKAKAIARAQLTKSGHVYVLSNIGSFGENVYKIGMTRRLEPLERVRELGSASVPFLFDVHAIIYSENAPELEYKLHRRFESRRVNVVNARKEFFRVTVEEIRQAVEDLFGQVTFFMEAQAHEYRQTVASHAEEKNKFVVVAETGFQNKVAVAG